MIAPEKGWSKPQIPNGAPQQSISGATCRDPAGDVVFMQMVFLMFERKNVKRGETYMKPNIYGKQKTKRGFWTLGDILY